MSEWVELAYPETWRTMRFIGDLNNVVLWDVTHIIKRESGGVMLKHRDGVFFFEPSQVQWIDSKVEDWSV